jgi:D-arginine dehydrogenase
VLKVGEDPFVAGVVDRCGRKLDANALLQALVRAVKRGSGEVVQGSPALSIRREGSQWHVTTAQGDWRAPVLVSATGAWADKTAALAGVRPLGLSPLRRTIIVLDPPQGVSVAD